jgi:hypothetical protein
MQFGWNSSDGIEVSAEHCVEEAIQEMIGNDIMFCQLSWVS